MKKTQLSLLLVSAVCAFSGCAKSNQDIDYQSSNGKVNDTPVLRVTTRASGRDMSDVPYEHTYYDYEKHYVNYDFQNKYDDELKIELHRYFINEHKTYVTYANYWYYTNTAADLVPNTEENELFYTGKNVSRVSRDNQDREHVWPCAQSNGLWTRYGSTGDLPEEHNIDSTKSGGYWGAGSDLYHVRPATSRVNQTRSNAKFYEFDPDELSQGLADRTITRLSDGGPYACYVDSNKNKFEVDDAFKGDVARIILYIWVHYSSLGYDVYYSSEHQPVYSLEEGISEAGHSPYVCGLLALTSILNCPNETACFETLVRWNRIDPPSIVEANRNNYIESVQGNRNPFVDYPQLVEHMLYGED